MLLRLVAALPGQPLTPEALLAILKHPLVASVPGGRGPHLRLVGRIETKKLRGGPPWVRWGELADFAASLGATEARWLAWLRTTMEPLADIGRGPLAEHVARHRAAIEALAAGPDGGCATGSGARPPGPRRWRSSRRWPRKPARAGSSAPTSTAPCSSR